MSSRFLLYERAIREGKPLREIVEAAIERNNGNKSAAARELGVSKQNIHAHINRWAREDEAALAEKDKTLE